MLLPHELQRYARPLQLAVDRRPVGLCAPTFDRGQRRRGRKQLCLQRQSDRSSGSGQPTVAAMLVSDNLKSGITKACFYEPEVNRSYAEMAAHYGTAIVPARPYKPRDKAKVEVAVLLATRWIIAKLRNRRFFSITELNDAIRDCVTTLNERVTRRRRKTQTPACASRSNRRAPASTSLPPRCQTGRADFRHPAFVSRNSVCGTE
jgi:hypothetical protein